MDLGRSHIITAIILILAVAGLAGIYVATASLVPADVSISSIEAGMTGKLVRIAGTVSKIRKSASNNVYWTVDDGSSITVPLLDGKLKTIAAKTGDAVEIVGLVSQYNGMMSYLLGHGIETRWAPKRFHNTHAKFMVVDGSTVLVGSMNWSEYGLKSNREASVVIYSNEAAAAFQRIFDSDFSS